jgi:hypothetical protein
MSDHAAVLFANDAFYLAVAGRDIAAMGDVWAETTPVCCLHPGWPPLVEREDILESWRRILENSQQPSIDVFGATVRLVSDCAIVLCYEVVTQNYLIATNIFVQENGLWRMIHHQSGGTPPPEEMPEVDPPETVQ